MQFNTQLKERLIMATLAPKRDVSATTGAWRLQPWLSGALLVGALAWGGPLLAAPDPCPSSMLGDGNASSPCEITSWTQLAAINDSAATLGLHYKLMNDLDESTTGYEGRGDGWTPIGNSGDAFTGHFDGDGKTISNLIVVESSETPNQGLFGRMTEGTIENLKLNNVSITSNGRFTGGLVGRVQAVNVGAVSIQNIEMDNVTILTTIDASSANVGGLVGRLDAGSNSNTNIAVGSVLIKNLTLTHDFTRGNYIGGIVGESEHEGSGVITLRKLAVRDGIIDAKRSQYVGGLVGRLRKNSFLDDRNLFIGRVDGGYEVGGLAGRLSRNSILNFGYVQADVTGHTTGENGGVGIITGYTSSNDQSITEIYAVGTAKHATEDSSEAPRIGIVGYSDNDKIGGDVFEDIYYSVTSGELPFLGDKDPDGQPTITNVVELTRAQMQGAQASQNMTGVADASRWNFVSNWQANEGAYPIFKWEADEFNVVAQTIPEAPTNVVATAGNGSVAISWTAPVSDGGSAITGYTVTGSPAGSCQVAATDTQCTITGLTNGTAYTFTAVATNAVGSSSVSAASASVTPAGLPSAPLDIQVTPSVSRLQVSWTAPLDNGGTPIVRYVARANPSCEVLALPNEVPGETQYSCELINLSPEQTYQVFVSAVTGAGETEATALGGGSNNTPASFAPLPAIPVPVNNPWALLALVLMMLGLVAAGSVRRRVA